MRKFYKKGRERKTFLNTAAGLFLFPHRTAGEYNFLLWPYLFSTFVVRFFPFIDFQQLLLWVSNKSRNYSLEADVLGYLLHWAVLKLLHLFHPSVFRSCLSFALVLKYWIGLLFGLSSQNDLEDRGKISWLGYDEVYQRCAPLHVSFHVYKIKVS